jgi:uncharacterized peroxidase-related enzyme
MTWIRTIAPSDAQGELDEICRAIASSRGGVAEIHQAQSLNPRALRAHLELYRAVVFQRSTLERLARERIAVVVSLANRCSYCVAHHAEALRQLGDDSSRVDALARGEGPVGLNDADAALLQWAGLAARDPTACGEAGIETLKAHGFDDRAILDATLTVAYFSYVNRIVLLLGVRLEDDYARTCRGDAGVTP